MLEIAALDLIAGLCGLAPRWAGALAGLGGAWIVVGYTVSAPWRARIGVPVFQPVHLAALVTGALILAAVAYGLGRTLRAAWLRFT